MTRAISEYERLTGFRPTKRVRRFVVLLDYGYGPNQWVVHGSAQTEDSARKLRRSLPQWPDSKVRIIDRESESR